MIDCLFTIDYEIYGNGEGSLRELVYEPAEKLKTLFRKHNLRFVLFVEAAELEKIGEQHTDACIHRVRRQIREAHREGFEIGLHLHPQWYNARYVDRRWLLDYNEYNLCSLSGGRIACIVDRSISYLRNILDEPGFTPFSFRAGNWLFQPTKTAAGVLAGAGIKIDSSVFKGGFQRAYRLDYRPALKNGYYWPFQDDINECDPSGSLIEMPIHAVMVPFWSMVTAKRIGMQRRSAVKSRNGQQSVKRLRDYLRFRYPLKLDFCRMTAGEMISLADRVISEDRESPEAYRPLVAIGHTKDLVDIEPVERFLSYLRKNGIPVTTFREAYSRRRFQAAA